MCSSVRNVFRCYVKSKGGCTHIVDLQYKRLCQCKDGSGEDRKMIRNHLLGCNCSTCHELNTMTECKHNDSCCCNKDQDAYNCGYNEGYFNGFDDLPYDGFFDIQSEEFKRHYKCGYDHGNVDGVFDKHRGNVCGYSNKNNLTPETPSNNETKGNSEEYSKVKFVRCSKTGRNKFSCYCCNDMIRNPPKCMCNYYELPVCECYPVNVSCV